MVSKKAKSNKKPEQSFKTGHSTKPIFGIREFLGIILIIVFFTFGSIAGTYGELKNLMGSPCLGCLGLYPNVQLEFTFETVDGKAHPDFVIDALKNDGPVLIEYTRAEVVCPPCGRMDPHVEELVREYREEVVFFIINDSDNEMKTVFKEKEETKAADSVIQTFYTYDIDNFGTGGIATPTYVIITLGNENGIIRPYFAVGYGEFVEEDAEKTKKELANVLDFAIERYILFENMYN